MKAGGTMRQLAVATADLAVRLGIAEDRIEVVEVREVTWGDASLGCPVAGMVYAQRLVPGTLIVLRAAGETHEYHAGAGRGPFPCANPVAPIAAGEGRDGR